jgi:hypothetical protein
MKKRDLNRCNGIEWWEIDQAQEKGFVTTEQRKPRTGCPSNWVKIIRNPHPELNETSLAPYKVSKNHPTKLLPSRFSIERPIRYKEWDFAFWYVVGEFGPDKGLFGFKRCAWMAYMKAYTSCHSKAAARSSASRLLKRPRVKVAIAWEFAKLDRLPEIRRFHPWTATEVWDILHRLGSERARWAPYEIRQRWIIADIQTRETPPIFR